MIVELENVVPWGRSLDEYRLMFKLSPQDLSSSILGCGDGPASFNCEMNQLGLKVVSVDPIYALTQAQIQRRIDETYDIIMAQCKTSVNNFVWSFFSDPDELGQHRLASMKKFLQDYDCGRRQERYVAGSLPVLGFADQQFSIALCSHLLFLYSEQLSLEFHLESIREMCRVAKEVRIFPLLDLRCDVSRHLEPVIEQLGQEGIESEVVEVKYEFQRGGNSMLRVQAATAVV